MSSTQRSGALEAGSPPAARTVAARTEIALSGGQRVCVEGDPHEVEAVILSAARGSLMELAWMTDADSGQPVGVNPDHVLMLRGLDPGRQ